MSSYEQKLQEKKVENAKDILAFSNQKDEVIEITQEEAELWKDFKVNETEQQSLEN
ncbi:TPA: hypothetical protein R4O11_001728 [Campylobacter jejuni]|nr:hypothetical protein [Campylobacter jejuni]